MSKTTLNPYLNLARKVVRNLKAISQREIAEELNVTQSTVSYGINKKYTKEIERALRLIYLGGYEVVEREEI